MIRCDDESIQANVICDAVLEAREHGVMLMHQAVLFRTGHHSDGLEIELGRRNIPFVKFGGLKFLETAHVKDTLALLRILDNPTDELAWHRVFGLLEGVGPAWARRIADDLGVTARTDGALKTFLETDMPVPPAAIEHLSVLKQCLADCVGPPDPPPATQIERLLPFLHIAFERAYPYNAKTREGDVEAMVSMAGSHKTRGAFLADLAIDPPANTTEVGPPHLDDDWLVLSTIHSAKGGEWQNVYVIHASDGNIPSDMALGEPGGVDEERRLLYVAMTRARDSLTVTYPQRFYHRRHGKDDAHVGPAVAFPDRARRRDRRVVGRTAGHARRVRARRRPDAGILSLSDLWSAKLQSRVPRQSPAPRHRPRRRAQLPRPRRVPDRRRAHHGVGPGVPRRLGVVPHPSRWKELASSTSSASTTCAAKASAKAGRHRARPRPRSRAHADRSQAAEMTLVEWFTQRGPEENWDEEYVAETYRENLTVWSDVFARLITELGSAEHRPAVFHCTAGKDRTASPPPCCSTCSASPANTSSTTTSSPTSRGASSASPNSRPNSRPPASTSTRCGRTCRRRGRRSTTR